MSVGIECPVCEAVFQVKQVSSKTGIRCPKCDRKFRYSKEVLATKQPAKKTSDDADLNPAKSKAKKRPNSEPATADSKPQRKLKRKQKPKQTASTATTELTQDNHKFEPAASESNVPLDQDSTKESPSQSSGKIDVGETNSSKITLIQAGKRQKARRQTSRAITSIVILSIAMVVLGYFLYRQLNHTPPVEQTAGNTNGSASNKTPIDPSELDSDPSGPHWQESAGDRRTEIDQAEPDLPDEDEKPIELPRVSADDLPERDFEYLQTKELRSVWQRIRPRLVALEVRTDVGVTPSVGTIVDSRGWALTSNQMVSKWPDVTATAAARDIDAYYAHIDALKENAEGSRGSTLLSDLSKGIASTLPKRDQTLIALNTRFVVALDQLEFATRTDIVPSMYLIQAAPPSPTNPYGYEEVKVHGRQEFEELETEARDKAKALGIIDPLANWIVTSKKAAPPIGTPVLTRTGKFVATHTFSTKQFAYFLMADQTRNLIAQAAASNAEGGKLQIVDATTDLLSKDHSMSRPSQLMNIAGLACENFGWIPNDSDQYLQLQKFTRRFSTVAKFVQDQQDDASESISLSILSDQIKRWQRSLSQSIRDAKKTTPEKIDQLNAIAVDKLSASRPNNANTYIPFVAEVYSAGFDSEDQNSILMTIGEGQAIIKVPHSPESGPMRPGSQWLCFYKRPSRLNRKQLKLGSGEIVPLYSDGKILLVLGPIRKR